MLNIFNNIYKKRNNIENKQSLIIKKIKKNEKEKLGLNRHFPPSTKTWFNSIYSYDKNTIKSIPVLDLIVNNLIKMYFNLNISVNLNEKYRNRRNKAIRYSTNKIFVSKAEMKHSNDKVIITIYTYNRIKKYYFKNLEKLFRIIFISKMENHPEIDSKLNLKYKNLRKLYLKNFFEIFYINNKFCAKNFFLKKIFNSLSLEGSKIFKKFLFRSDILIKLLIENKLYYVVNLFKNNKLPLIFKFLNLKSFNENKKKYYEYFIKEILIKEMLYLNYNQLFFNDGYKYNNIYLTRLNNIISTIYNKKIEFNIVNLKYIHLDSRMLLNALSIKIKTRKNKLLRILQKALALSKITYSTRYKYNVQDLYIRKYNNLKPLNSKLNIYINDILNTLLKNIYNISLKDEINLSTKKSQLEREKYIYRSVKFRLIRGVRLEAKGRLTKRLVASRSISKLSHKGSLKNLDCSFNNLSSVLLRGSLKSNLDYVNINSKNRIGSFGLKGWISGK